MLRYLLSSCSVLLFCTICRVLLMSFYTCYKILHNQELIRMVVIPIGFFMLKVFALFILSIVILYHM